MLNIYTPDMVKVGVIADYESLIYSPHFYEPGVFEMYININKQYTEELKMNNIIQINDNHEKTMFITHRSLPLNDSGRSGETLFIKGYTLDGLTTRRNIVTNNENAFMSFEGSQEYIMKQFVYKNMINADDKSRNIPGLKLSSNKNLGKQDRWRGRQEKLSDKLSEIGLYAELGWNIVFDNHKKEFIFDVKKGVNRQLDNGTRSPVIFELSFGNVLSREFTEDITNSANVIYVGGNGELEEKLIQKVGDTSGFSRIEVYQEHSSVDNVKELTTIGEQTLKELEKTENFNTIVSPNGSYIYEEDYFLGDYVTIIDKQLNIKVNTQITGVKEINEGLGGVEITFGKMIPTIFNTMATSEKSRILDIPDKASGEEGKPGTPGKDGVGLNYHWNGTKLGIKREDDTNYSYMDLVGKQGIQGLQGIPGKNGVDGKQGISGKNGIDGKSLEYNWNGTKLGIRQQGEAEYSFMDLLGPRGIQGIPGKVGSPGKDGTDATVTKGKVVEVLGYTPLEKVSWTDISSKPSVFNPAPHTHNEKADTTYVDKRDNEIIGTVKHIEGKLNSEGVLRIGPLNADELPSKYPIGISEFYINGKGDEFNFPFLYCGVLTYRWYAHGILQICTEATQNSSIPDTIKMRKHDMRWSGETWGEWETVTTKEEVQSLIKILDDKKAEVSWTEVKNKPNSFNPSSHSHSEYATNTKVNELEAKFDNLDIPEGVDLKPVYTKIDDLDNKKADKTIKDETTTNEYELVVRDGKPFLRVTK